MYLSGSLPYYDSLQLSDTNGPMASTPEQISPPFIRDGRTYKGIKVFHVHQHDGDQML
jgi:hypothetical protein